MVVKKMKPEEQPPKSKGVILIVLTISLLPMLLIGGVILYQFETAYHNKIFDHLTVLVNKHSRTINGFLVDRLADIRVLARTPSAMNLRDQVFLQDQLAILREEYGNAFVDLGLIDPDGIQVAYSGPFNLANANYTGARWFFEAQKEEYFLSDVFTGLRGSPHFIVAVKVRLDGQGYILRATVDFQAFNALVSNIRIGATGFAFILNQDGEFQTKPEFDVALNDGPYKKFLKSRLVNDKVIIREEPDGWGRKSVFVFTALNNGRWVLCFQQEQKDAFAALSSARMVALILFLTSAVLIALVALFLSRRMTYRITEALEEKDKMGDQVVEAGRLASLGELAAGIAHEINNPVAIMVEEAGWIQDLLEEDEPAGSENLAEIERATIQIRTQGIRCKEITQKLLSFARKTDPTIKVIRINGLIEEVVSLIDQKTRYANVKVEMGLDPDLPPLQASATELQQVLLNLINNGVDAMDQSGGTIKISSRADDGRIVVDIEDNGIGIAEANLPRVFDPFYTTKPVGQGTGLGLSICYGIVKKLGGEISVRSAKQKGTTFTLILPALEKQETGGRDSDNSPDKQQPGTFKETS